jgi:hypothetical protein
MCFEDATAEMAGLSRDHLACIQDEFEDDLMVELAADIFEPMTADLQPHLPALPAFIALVESLKVDDYGILADYNLVRLPLSLVGADKVRYRTEVVSWLHEAILSLRMSELTVNRIRQALGKHGLSVLFQCSCGVVLGRSDDIENYFGSDHHRRMDALRSAIDAEGNPVVHVTTLDDIPVPTMDLHTDGAEKRLLDRIQELTECAASEGSNHYPWIDAELQRFIAATQSSARKRALA